MNRQQLKELRGNVTSRKVDITAHQVLFVPLGTAAFFTMLNTENAVVLRHSFVPKQSVADYAAKRRPQIVKATEPNEKEPQETRQKFLQFHAGAT